MTPQHRQIALIGVLIVCAGLVIWDRQTPSNSEVVGAVVRQPNSTVPSTNSAPVVASNGAGNDSYDVQTLAPRDVYKDEVKNVFAVVNFGAKAAAIEAKKIAEQQASLPPPPPPVPTAPPMPFAVIGKQKAGQAWEVFLAKADQTFVVHEGDNFAGTYQVVSIKPPIMQVRYLPLNQNQTLMIGASFDD